MKFTVVVFACVLAAAAAQLNQGQYFPQKEYQYNQYNRYNNRYNGQQYNGQYNGNPFNSNRYQNYKPYKPYASSTPFPPRPAVVVEASASVAPPAVPAPAAPAPAVPSIVLSAAPIVPVKPAVLASIPVAKIVSDARSASIVRYDNEINPDGSYRYAFETENGIAAQAQGVPRSFGGNPPVTPDVAEGSFSWTSPEGEVIAISYIADENGYQPSGNALPVAPEIPAQIARALDYIARSAKN